MIHSSQLEKRAFVKSYNIKNSKENSLILYIDI